MAVFLIIFTPFLALLICKVLFELILSKRGQQLVGCDQMYDIAYDRWCRNLMASDGRLEEVYSPLPMMAGETCYACNPAVALYVPIRPSEDAPEGVLFDTVCGTHVGQGWSIVESFPGVKFQGRGMLCLTNGRLRFDALGCSRAISLGSIHTVAASCSELLVGAWELDRPLVFQGVNGQQFRDAIHILMEEAG